MFKRISIERYTNPETVQATGYAGSIEGEDENGKKWIMWLNANGAPEIFWPEREEDGSVVGPGIAL